MDGAKLLGALCSGDFKSMFQGINWGDQGINSACMPGKLTPLLHVIKLGRLDFARVLIDLGADVKLCVKHKYKTGDETDFLTYKVTNFSPMKCAALYDHVDILKALFEEFDAGSLEKTMVSVVLGGSVECLEYLVRNGVDINKNVTFSGCPSPIVHLAARLGHVTMLKKLVKLGSDVNVRDSKGWTAIYKALYGRDPKTRIAMYRALQSVGANFEITIGSDKKNIFHLAASKGKVEDIKVLASLCPVLVESKDKNGERAVHYAKDVNTLKCLIELSADITAISRQGYTALDIAVMTGDKETIDFLMPINPYTQSIPQSYYKKTDKGPVFEIPESINDAITIDPTIRVSFPHVKANLRIALLIKSSPKLDIHSCISCDTNGDHIHFCLDYRLVWFQRHNEGIRIEMNSDEDRISQYLLNQANGGDLGANIVFLDAKRDDDKEIYCNTLMRDLFIHSKEHLNKKYAVGGFKDGTKETNCSWFCLSFLKKNGYTIDKNDLKQCIESVVPNAGLAKAAMEQFSILYKRDASELAQIAPRLFKKRKESQGASNNAEPANPMGIRETMPV